jgi:2-oxoglutarate dehydrogenase E2 component (dihydrolipoamide succinyltransferase)
MPMELKVPSMGESITEVTIGAWHKQEGEAVEKDENLLDIESEKATFEVPAPVAGVVTKILKKQGDKATVGETVAVVDETAVATKGPAKAAAPAAGSSAPTKSAPATADSKVMPAAKRALAETGVSPAAVQATGPGGRTLKEDVMRAAAAGGSVAAAAPTVLGDRAKETVAMTTIRQTIARRLVEAQSTAALLTTFNEVDMSGVMAFRKKYQDDFTKRYGIKLGFMSFFVKAAVDALRRFPSVNAQIKGTDIIYHNYCDIGIAVGGGKGLVVPILRNAERMSFAEIEAAITDFGNRAKENAIKMDELTGGTFTISNGGIYGSMLSTPIVNPPQSAILGMHNITERAVVRDGQVVVRPIMYLALTYDHRIIDGREGVQFLVRIKEGLEDPARLFVEV